MNQQRYTDRTYGKFDLALKEYAKKIFQPISQIDELLAMETKEHLRLPPSDEQMHICKTGDSWGEEWGNIWLKTTITVPEEADGRCLCALPETGAVEVLCFKNGKPAGIINSKNQFIGGMHSAMFVSPCAKAGEVIELAFECYAGHPCPGCNPWDNYGNDYPQQNYRKSFGGIVLVVMDEVINKMVFDLATVLQMARLPQDNFLAQKAHKCLMCAFPNFLQDIIYTDIEEIRASAMAVTEALMPALEKGVSDGTRGKVGIMGHSHMDTAWLWPVSETIRKCARTYSQALTLMDMYPEYTFIQSSALHLDWMRQYYPDIFEGICEKVKEGRYEPNGGVWVECDCNITGGESMVRQFLYGQRFTRKYCGYTSDAFWLPDTFGYNAAIPQIMQGCDVKYFYTTKMSWSDLNTFPVDTFVWRGMDGTEVITHLNQMNVIPDVSTVTRSVDGIRDKRSASDRLVAYGFGDGGGGPTYAMLEFARRVQDVAGLPEVKPVTASSFMQRLEAIRDTLPVFDGELYLEYHRGTLTQMHDIKRNNRKAEIALHHMEYFNVLSGCTRNEKTDELYKILLKNQFHDILPGTSIESVNVLARKEVTGLIEAANVESGKYITALTTDKENTVTLFNTLSSVRDDVIELDGEVGVTADGETLVSQSYTAIDGSVKTAVNGKPLAGFSTDVWQITSPKTFENAFSGDEHKLETPFYSVEMDENGYITSLKDKRAGMRQVRNEKGAPLGTLWLGEDMPTNYDNWEIEDDIFAILKPVTSVMDRNIVSMGGVQCRIRTTYQIGKKSSAVVDTVFYAASPRIDFVMQLNWDERHTLLKAGFDVDVRAAFVKNEIQFGHVDRPTTRNNALECAKFEVCNHKFSDLSESRYGVALLNDCKYGISVDGSDMRLTLHKGGIRPDATNDRGCHTMTYSLLPHTGSFSAENVVIPAYALNQPVVIAAGDACIAPIAKIDATNILCEAVKMAEDVENAYVLRLYECERNRTNVTVALRDAKKVWKTNMLEEKQEELPLIDGKVSLQFHPFEIVTLLVER